MKRLCLILLCLLLCGCEPETDFESAFCDLIDQSRDTEQAAADGCVVLRGTDIHNLDRFVQFIKDASSGTPCEVRIVLDGSMMHHLIYDGESYLSEYRYRSYVVRRRYQHLLPKGDRFILSCADSLALADEVFCMSYGRVQAYFPMSNIMDKLDEKTAAQVRARVSPEAEDATTMTAWTENGTYSMQLRWENGIYTLGSTQYRADEAHPVLIVPHKGDLLAVIFATPSGNAEARLYDAKTQAFTDTYYGTLSALAAQMPAPQLHLPEAGFAREEPTLFLETAEGIYVPRAAASGSFNAGDGWERDIDCFTTDPPQWEEWTEVPTGEMRLIFPPDVTPTRISVTFWPTDGPSQDYEIEGDSCVFTSPGFVEITAHFEQGEFSDTDLFYDITAHYGFRIVE